MVAARVPSFTEAEAGVAQSDIIIVHAGYPKRVRGWYLPGSGDNHDVVIIVNFDDNLED